MKQNPVDLRYGFPGEMPSLRTSGQTEKLLEFFNLVAQGMNKRQAGVKVGYSKKWANTYSSGYLKRYQDYVQWLQAHYAQAAVQHISVDQDRALEELESIAMANWHDYLVHEPTKDGKVATRMKALHELTKEQMRAIEVVGAGGPKNPITYKMRDRDGNLVQLLKTMGLLNEKVILEHRHRHLHVHANLTNVPMDKLEALEAEYEELLQIDHKAPDEDHGDLKAPEPKVRKNGNGKGH